MEASLPDFPAFDVDSDTTSLGQRWKKWLSKYENLLIAVDITESKRSKALLLHYARQSTQDIFETLPDLPATDSAANIYYQAVAKLSTYFNPKKDVEFEIYLFRQAKQQQGETLDTYHTRLRQLAATCEFWRYRPRGKIPDCPKIPVHATETESSP